MTRKVSGRLRLSFLYCLPSARILDRFNDPEPFNFFPPATPGNFCFGIGDEAHVFRPSSAHSGRQAGRSPPTRRVSPRTHGPLIPDREALCASTHSLCRFPTYHISYDLLPVTYTRTDMASKEVARKDNSKSCTSRF